MPDQLSVTIELSKKSGLAPWAKFFAPAMKDWAAMLR